MQSKKSILRISTVSDRQQFGRISVTEEQWATISAAEEIVSSLETNERRFFISGITVVEWQRIIREVEMIVESDERGLLYQEHPQFNFSNMHRTIITQIAKECGRVEIRSQEDMLSLENREVKFDEEWQLAMKVIKGINKHDDCKFISDIHKFAIKIIWKEVCKELDQHFRDLADSDRASDEWAKSMSAYDVEIEQDPDRWEQGFDSAEYDSHTGFPNWYVDDSGIEPNDEE